MLAKSIRFFYRESKKKTAIFHRIPHYEAVPYYMRPMHRDEHDYKLRTLQEVKEEIENTEFEYDLKYRIFSNSRYPFDDGEGKVVAYINLLKFNLTKMQRKRMILLLGSRYKGSDRVTISCDIHKEPDQNAERLQDMIEELIIEAKRAP